MICSCAAHELWLADSVRVNLMGMIQTLVGRVQKIVSWMQTLDLETLLKWSAWWEKDAHHILRSKVKVVALIGRLCYPSVPFVNHFFYYIVVNYTIIVKHLYKKLSRQIDNFFSFFFFLFFFLFFFVCVCVCVKNIQNEFCYLLLNWNIPQSFDIVRVFSV
jgi:hypothetical protein